MGSFFLVHTPHFYEIALAVLLVVIAALAAGDKAIDTAHRMIGLLRDWRDFRRGD